MDKYQWLLDKYLPELANCRLCPRNCGVNRLVGVSGVCGAASSFSISSICIHKGEEPAVSGTNGICNIFFSRCNLACRYCQNWQISKQRGVVQSSEMSLEDVVGDVIALLDQGCESVGFVSPTHFIPQVKMVVEALRSEGRNPVFVYNTNGYDSVDEIRKLEPFIDVYLPDFKYADPSLAGKLSGAKDYPEKALASIREMFRQKGSTLILRENGLAERGLIIRHLVLPSFIENSLKALQLLADQVSESVSLSLMAQYAPPPALLSHSTLNRTITKEEYDLVVHEMERLGFYKGWVQELESSSSYLPDFMEDHPFEKE